MSVAELLAQSRAAHAQSFPHRGRIDDKGRLIDHPRTYQAGSALSDALRLRLEAHALDPQHLDPAWLEDAAANKGVSSDALVDFYAKYLTPVDIEKAPPNALSTQAGDH